MKHLKEGLIKQRGSVKTEHWFVVIPYKDDFIKLQQSPELPKILDNGNYQIKVRKAGIFNAYIFPESLYTKFKFNDRNSKAWMYNGSNIGKLRILLSKSERDLYDDVTDFFNKYPKEFKQML